MSAAPPSAARPSRPAFAVLVAHAVLSPIVLWTLSDDAFEPPKIALLQTAGLVLAGILGCGYVARAWVARDAPAPPLPRDLAGWGALAVVAAAAASTLASASPTTSLFGAARSHLGLLSIAAFALLFLASRRAAADPGQARGLVTAHLAGAAGACAYALAQLAGLDPLPWKPTWSVATRPFGSLGQPNFLGAYLACVVPLAAFAAVSAARARRRSRAALLAGLSALFAGLCVLSLSRGAWLALLAGGAVLAIGWWRAGERTGALALLAAAAVAPVAAAVVVALDVGAARELLHEGVGWRLASLSALAGETRIHLWEAAWRMFLDHPLLGAGLDCFVVEFDRYRTPAYWLAEWNAGPTRAHDSILQIAATQGVAGLAAYGLLIAGIAAGARSAWAAGDAGRRAFAAALGAGLAAFVVQGLFGFTFSALGALAVTLAALLAPARARTAEIAPARGAGVRALQAAIWGLVACAWLALVVAPLYAEALRAEGNGLTVTGFPEAAVPRLERAIALDGARDAQWTDLGLAQYAAALRAPTASVRRARLAQAQRAQERAIAFTPHRAYAHSNLARTLLAQAALDPPAASPDAVRERYDRALALDAANAYVLRDAIHAAYSLAELDRAEALARRAIAQYPSYASPHLYLGLVRLRAGDLAGAADSLEAARAGDWVVDRASGPALARTALAAARLARRELDEAVRLAQESAGANPMDHVAWTHLGAAREGIAEELRARARSAPSEAERTGLEDEARQRVAEALDAYRRAAAIAPENPAARAGVARLGPERAGE
jgi:O-antigen ligase